MSIYGGKFNKKIAQKNQQHRSNDPSSVFYVPLSLLEASRARSFLNILTFFPLGLTFKFDSFTVWLALELERFV